MPLYDYHCENCGPFRHFRPISERSSPLECDECGAEAERILTATQLNVMSSNNRIAETRNEKSAHEPGVVNVMKPAHEPGPRAPKPQHGHAHAHRPWMLGH